MPIGTEEIRIGMSNFITSPASEPKTPPMPDMAHVSIATMEQVTLNGSQQWITMRGKHVHDPVLLQTYHT